jgi:hypothetical protein
MAGGGVEATTVATTTATTTTAMTTVTTRATIGTATTGTGSTGLTGAASGLTATKQKQRTNFFSGGAQLGEGDDADGNVRVTRSMTRVERDDTKRGRTESQRHSTTDFTKQTMRLSSGKDDELVWVHVDGAKRNNGVRTDDTERIDTAFAAFISWEFYSAAAAAMIMPHESGRQNALTLSGNNAAEMAALIEGHKLAMAYLDAGNKTRRFIIMGDSFLAISRAARIQGGDRSCNDTRLARLTTELIFWMEALAQRVDVEYLQVPRAFNVCADELCNAVLDRREPNKLLVDVSFEVLANMPPISSIMERIVRTRDRCWRMIPTHLRHRFVAACNLLVADAMASAQRGGYADGSTVALWTVASARILLRHSNRSGSRKVNHLSNTLALAAAGTRARQSLVHAFLYGHDIDAYAVHVGPKPAVLTTQPEVQSAERQIHGHIAAGALGKAMMRLDSTCSIVSPDDDRALAVMRKTYISGTPLPAKVAVTGDAPRISDATFIELTMRLRRNAAPGLLNWTRELLLTLRGIDGTTLRAGLAEVVNSMLSDSVHPLLHEALRSVVGIQLEDQLAAKIRTVGLTEKLTSIAWRAALSTMPLRTLVGAHQMMGRRGGVAIAGRRIQETIDRGGVVVIGDVVNCHPTCSRARQRTFVAKEAAGPIQRLWNFFYTSACQMRLFHRDGSLATVYPVTDGLMQGCTSAGPLQMCTHADVIAEEYASVTESMVGLMDDVAVAAETEAGATARFDHAATMLARAGADLHGPKTHVVAQGRPSSVFGGVIVGDRGQQLPVQTLDEVKLKGPKPLKRFVRRLAALETMSLPYQDKLILLRHGAATLQHCLMNSAPELTAPYAIAVNEAQKRVLYQLCGTSLLSAPTLTQACMPLGSAGLGMVDARLAPLLYDAGTTNARNAEAPEVKQIRPLFDKESAYGMAVIAKWRSEDVRSSRRFAYLDLERPWYRFLPTRRQLQLTDGGVTFGLRTLLNVSTAMPMCSRHVLREAGASDDEEGEVTNRCTAAEGTLDHALSCTHCCSWRKRRHDGMLRTMMQASRFYSTGLDDRVLHFLRQAEPREPRMNAGLAPDAVVVRDAAGGLDGVAVFIDLAVVHHTNEGDFPEAVPAQRMFAFKQRKYRGLMRRSFGVDDRQDDQDTEDEVPVHEAPSDEQLADPQRMVWSRTLSQRVYPIIFASDGHIHTVSWRLLLALAKGTVCPRDEFGALSEEGFAHAALRNMQTMLLNFSALSLKFAECGRTAATV